MVEHEKSFLLIFSLLGLFSSSFAQDNSFENSYQKINTEIIATDINEAIKQADSLSKIAKTDEQKIKALMLLATINQSVGDDLRMIEYAKKARKIAALTGFWEWNARASGFLASNLRKLGLESESEKYLESAMQACKHITDKNANQLTKINILQEKAIRLQNEKRFEESIVLMKLAKSLASSDSNQNHRSLLVKAINDQMLGVSYLGLGEYRNADFHFRTSLSGLKGLESNLIPYNYRGIAEMYLKQDNLDSAKYYLDLSKAYIQSSNRQELKVLVYSSYVKYFKQLDKFDSTVYYLELQNEVTTQQNLESNKFLNQLSDSLINEQNELRKLTVVFWWVLGGTIGVFVLICFLLFKKNKQKIFLSKNQALQFEQQDLLSSTWEDQISSGKPNHIALETEIRLITQLNELENKLFFLDHHVTLNKLSQLLNTNQKYTSFIIKKYKKQDFNQYIMYTRIRYLIVLLKTNPDLMEYKLSQIASIAGFSSHSKFAIAFKIVVGLTPSSYIQNLSRGE